MASSLYPSYSRSEYAFERGEGSFLFDANGNRYLDCIAGIGVSCLGHGHPEVVDALKSQADKLWHVSNLYQIPEQEKLAERLCALTFAERVFFGNSGAEAMECAIKTARRYHHEKGKPERYRVIALHQAFHGRTLATIAAAGQAKLIEGFEPVMDAFDQVPSGDIEALKAMVGPQTAGIIVEPIQGEGGINIIDQNYLREVRALCDAEDLILIFDEIQCGFGRTGDLFAYQTYGVTPDVMAIAKGLGAGFPIGACLATAKAGDAMGLGSHGSTFGGNPLGCAVGLSVLNIVSDPKFLLGVQEKSRYARQKFAQLGDLYPEVFGGLRGEGLMMGIEVREAPGTVVSELRKLGLLTGATGQPVIRLLPPLTISEEEIELAYDILDRYGAEKTKSKAEQD